MAEDLQDAEIMRMMQGLDEVHQLDLLVTLDDGSPVPDEEQSERLDRVQRAAVTKLGLYKSDDTRHQFQMKSRLSGRYFTRKSLVAGIVGAVIVASILTITPGPVSAALKQFFSFVPGIGTVETTEGSSTIAVLKEPLHATWANRQITVKGMMISSTDIIVQLDGHGAWPSKVSFQAGGQTIHLDAFRAISVGSGDGTTWSGEYSVSGSFNALTKQPSGTLIIDPDTRVHVHLHSAKGVAELAKLGPTQSHQGITMTAMAARNGQLADLTLVAQYQGPYHIWNMTPSISSAVPGIQIQDAEGHPYRAESIQTLGPGNQVSFEPKPGVTEYDVTVPRVDATFQGEATVVLPIPEHGSQPLDKTVNLGEFPIHFTKAERVQMEHQLWLRLYFDLHANLTEPKELHAFSVDTNSEGQLDLQTGALKWLEVQVKPGQRQVMLHLSQPQVYIRGPWTFYFHLPNQASNQK